MRDALLGVDLGQTRMKAVLFDLDGVEIGGASDATEPDHARPLWAERDLRSLQAAVVDVVRRALASHPGVRIIGVGLSGHSDGLYLVDEHQRPVRPAILATDARARAEAAALVGRAGPRLLELTGQLPMAASPASLLHWLRRHEPHILDDAAWVLSSTDWLAMTLTGCVSTDTTMAAAGFVALGERSWSRESLELYDLTEVEHMLPPVRDSWDVAGAVTSRMSAATGLRLALRWWSEPTTLRRGL